MSAKDDEFTKLFKYMQEFRIEVNGKIDDVRDELKDDIGSVQNALDGLIDHYETHEGEIAALNSQTSRHENQIEQIAHTIDLDLNTIEA
jgi:predicted  nucleic acid-binding Zn-ribbon protein